MIDTPEEDGISPGQYLMLVGLVLPAFLLRYYLFTLNAPLWLDEAMLALNIRARDLPGLAQPLMYDQGAPLGYLWLLKGLTIWLGESEFVLRAPSLVAGGLGLLFLAWLGQKTNGIPGRWFALGAMALSYPAVTYAIQAKQYSLDMAITLALWLWGLGFFGTGEERNRSWWALGFWGALSIWFSHPAVFTLAGLGGALILLQFASAKKKDQVGMLFAIGSWLVSFLILYFVQYRGLGANKVLTDYWAEYFLPISLQAPGWVYARITELARNPGGIWYWVPDLLLFGMFAIGLGALLWRKSAWAVMFSISLMASMAASAIHMYPFGGRLGLFLVPGIMLCIGASLDQFVLGWWHGREARKIAALAVAALILVMGAKFTLEKTIHPPTTEDMSGAMETLQDNYREGDKIYLYRFAAPVFRYYAPQYGLQDATLIEGSNRPAPMERLAEDSANLPAAKRVWLLFGHIVDAEYEQEQQALLQAAEERGSQTRIFRYKGTASSLYLYDLSQ